VTEEVQRARNSATRENYWRKNNPEAFSQVQIGKAVIVEGHGFSHATHT
jgi:hypothetical protein